MLNAIKKSILVLVAAASLSLVGCKSRPSDGVAVMFTGLDFMYILASSHTISSPGANLMYAAVLYDHAYRRGYDDGYTTAWWVYSNTNGQAGFDTIANAAVSEEEQLNRNAQNISAQFGLSAEQSLDVAKTINHFASLENRSEQDAAEFMEALYGVKSEKIAVALNAAKKGDRGLLEESFQEAAQYRQTSPENMKALATSLHAGVLNMEGIQL